MGNPLIPGSDGSAYNIKLGGKKNVDEVNLQELNAGININEVDQKYKSIFNALDKDGTTKGVLEKGEIDNFKFTIAAFAHDKIFSMREAKKMLSALGLKNVDAKTFFGFLKEVTGLSAQIKGYTHNPDDKTTTVRKDDGSIVTYDTEGRETKVVTRDGDKETSTEFEYKNENTLTQTVSETVNNKKIKQNKYEIIDGELKTREEIKYNEDGNISTTESYEYYKDADGKQFSRLTKETKDGITKTIEYDGETRTETFENHQSIAQINYNADGSRLVIYKDGTTRSFNKDQEIKLEPEKKENVKTTEKQKEGFSIGPKEGETFTDTMNRLVDAIKDNDKKEAFKEAFIRANPKAKKRGYFLLNEIGSRRRDINVPAKFVNVLDINAICVDTKKEMDSYKERIKNKNK